MAWRGHARGGRLLKRSADEASRRARVVVALLCVYLFWGTSYVAGKIMVTHLPPLLSAGIRYSIAGLLLAVLARWRGASLPATKPEWRHVAVLGVLGIFISHSLQIVALQHVASNQSALLNATPALWIAWLGTLGARGHPLDRSTRVALALGCVGVLLLLAPDSGPSHQGLGWQGVILVASLAWSLATIHQRNHETRLGPMMLAALQMLIGGVLMTVTGLAAGEAAGLHWTLPGMLAVLWLIVFSSCVAFTAYGHLVVSTSPAVVGSYGYVTPAVAAIAGWALLGETLSSTQIAGMLVVLVAIAVLGGYWPRRRISPV